MAEDARDWDPLRKPINRVTFAGMPTPGVATISGAGTPRRWDERESYGWSGAYIVYHGLNLSHFSVRVRLYTEQHWRDWHAFQPLVQRQPLGKRQFPIDVAHPILVMLGIHSVVVEDVLQPDQVEDGVWEIEIKLIEYRSPRLALAAAEATKAEAADPEDAIIHNIRQQVEAVGKERDDYERGVSGRQGL